MAVYPGFCSTLLEAQNTGFLAIHLICISSFSEIYKIVSQKQIRDSPDDENSPSNNVQTITVAPTDNSQSTKRPCCSV